MAKLLIIMHGKVALNDAVRSAIMAVRDIGHLVDVRVTWEAGDAELFATAAARSCTFDTVVAAGGDGTVNAVVTGLMHSGVERLPALAILPTGTANDFARACEIATGNPLSALMLALESDAVAVDVGVVNQRCFLNVATGGFGAEITTTTPEELKRILGGVAYLVTGIQQAANLRLSEATIRGPDFDWQGSFLALAVGNGRYAGGGIPMCTDALINDGLLDISILRDVTADELPRVMTDILIRGMRAREAALVSARVSELSIHSEAPLQLNLDGEPLQNTDFHFSVRAGALLMHLPSTSPVL
ncbi:MAG: lipid kinase YegS, partial [Halieaceae bacterium]